MSTAEREIFSSRVFDVSRELMWKAWTDPKHLAKWWGPKGFTNTFYEFDLTLGGYWRFTMHGPDGKDYRNESRFVEIVPHERLSFDHITGPMYRATVVFKHENGKTLVDWRMVFETVGGYEMVKSFAAEANQQNLDRLQAELAQM